MLEFVENLEQLVVNFKEYQKAAKGASSRVNPALVRAWYYIPSLGLAAPSRFIGYKQMTSQKYDSSDEVDGKQTEPHLKDKNWFREPIDELELRMAKSAAESLLKPTKNLHSKSRFCILKAQYSSQIKNQPNKI